MQTTLPDLEKNQLPLFNWRMPAVQPEPRAVHHANDRFLSEIALTGHPAQCLGLLAPILRALSDDAQPLQQPRWLTLVAPPSGLTHEWLRKSGLNRERILLLQAKDPSEAQRLTCNALQLGRSHTVVSWLNPLNREIRTQLLHAAHQGKTQCLNIRLSEQTGSQYC